MKNVLLILLLAYSTVATAQVGIGTKTPDNSAALDVASTTKGFLPPRMTFNQIKAINTPAKGLIVYCKNCSPEGIYVYDGSNYKHLPSGTVLGTPTDLVLAQIGKEANDPFIISQIKLTQLGTIIPELVGKDYYSAYQFQDIDYYPFKKIEFQKYIDNNPNLFSEPATVQEVQDMVDMVKVVSLSNKILDDIQYGGFTIFSGGDSVRSIPQIIGYLTSIVPEVSNIDPTKASEYYNYMRENQYKFSRTTIIETQQEVQNMVDILNTQINTTPVPLPSTITLATIDPYFIASVYDTDYLPYTTPTAPATLDINQAADAVREPRRVSISGSLPFKEGGGSPACTGRLRLTY
ncbi:MAG: hypothetical protein ACWIPJ_03230 [Polaribacter sp.]